jgi:hypothetical protein
MVALKHVIPMLSRSCHVERGQPHLVGLACALSTKEVLATVEPSQWVLLAVERGALIVVFVLMVM